MNYSVYAHVKDALGTFDVILRSNKLESKQVEDVEVENDTVVVTVACSDKDDEEKLEMTFSGCNLDHVIKISQNAKEICIKIKCAEQVSRIHQKVLNNHNNLNLKERLEKMSNEVINKDFICNCASCLTSFLSSKKFKTVESFKASVVDTVENIWCLCGCSNKDNDPLISTNICNHCSKNDLLGKMTVELTSDLSILEKCFVLDSQLSFYSILDKNLKLENGKMKVDDDMKIKCSHCDFLLGFSYNSEKGVTKSINLQRCKIDFHSMQLVTPRCTLNAWPVEINEFEWAMSAEISRLHKEHNTHRFVFKLNKHPPMHTNIMNTVVFMSEVYSGVEVVLKQQHVLTMVINHDEVWSDSFYFDVIEIPAHKNTQFLKIIKNNSNVLPSSLHGIPSKSVSFLSCR